MTRYLMRSARRQAIRRIWALKDEIFAVAAALRERRTLTQREIDALLV
jgi:hypothetical protein